MVDRTAIAVAEVLRLGQRAAYLIARDAALPARDVCRDRGGFTTSWIALRFLDPATAAQHFARIRRRQRQPDRARAGRLLAGPRRRSSRPLPQDARNAYAAAAGQSTSYYGQLARAKLDAADRVERRARRTRARNRLEIIPARYNCYFELDEREITIRFSPTWAERQSPTRWLGLAN